MDFQGGRAAAAPAARKRSRSSRANKQQSDFGIDFATARQHIGICQDFNKKGFGCGQGWKCGLLHAKGTKLYPSAGLELAKRIAKDASIGPVVSASEVHIMPVLGLTSYLIQHKSPLVVHRMMEQDNCFIFIFKKYPHSLQVAEIAGQRSVRVRMGDRVRTLHASDNITLPILYLHAVKYSAWATVLEVCASGFQHGAESYPYGIYSVDVGRQAELVKFYDGGAALVFEACAFAVDISPTSASGKAREHPHWIADK